MIAKQLSIFAIFFLIAETAYAGATAVYHEDLRFDGILAGEGAIRTLTLTTESKDTVSPDYTVEGDIKDWVSVEADNGFIMSRDNPLKLKIMVKAPLNASKGRYTGLITLSLSNAKSPVVSIDREKFVTLSLIVDVSGKEIRKLSVKNISVSSTEQTMPVDFFITMLNSGNVKINPVVKIKAENIPYESEIPLLPFEEKNMLISLPNNFDIGVHEASAAVYLVDSLIENKSLSFAVHKENSLIRKGALLYIENKEKAHPRSLVKIDSAFYNSGEISVYAKFKGKIYFNNSLFEEIESEQKYAPAGRTITLSSNFTTNMTGIYQIVGAVRYSDTISDEKSSVVEIVPLSEPAETVPLGFNEVSIVILAIVFLFITDIYCRRKILRQQELKKARLKHSQEIARDIKLH